MWRVVLRPSWTGCRRRLSSVAIRLEDEGDWSYASEWWRDHGDAAGRTVFRSHSEVGNGLVTVVAYPASTPTIDKWAETERQLSERYTKTYPEQEGLSLFNILGYQWRVLHFNDNTRQSTCKVMAAYHKHDTDSGSLYLVQQPHCLAVPYTKSVLSAGLSTLVSCQYDLLSAVYGAKPLHVLCIGHGGGSLPLFIASKIQGAIVHSVEIDPLVISASTEAMGFPASAVKEPSPGFPNNILDVLWGGIHERIFIFKSDAENFVIESKNTYDLVFMDAYDGDDVFSRKLWDPDGPFLKALEERLHPKHGTVVVNLHADSDILQGSHFNRVLPMGWYVTQVARAYKDLMGLAFAVQVPWLCNVTVVACKGGKERSLSGNKDSILSALLDGSNFVEHVIDLPFPCSEYVQRDFVLVD